MKERLRGSDYRFIAICLALFAVTTWYSVHNFYRAFPEASIDFHVGRADARVLAEGFLAGQGYNLAGYTTAERFTFDDDAKTFLERELGLKKANQIMGQRLRVWRWSYRWFRPLQKEEYRVDFATRGELAGFAHLISEDAPRPAITSGQARTLAEDFLVRRLGRDLSSLDFVESSDITRPNRQDRTFTWSERNFNVRDATYRLEVTILGNEVGGYREYLKIPEQWTRDYERLRAKNDVTSTFDAAATVLLLVALIAVLARRVRRKDVQCRMAALVGAMGAALSLLASLNEFTLQKFNYPTTDSYGSFVSSTLLRAVLEASLWGIVLFALTAGAEPIYREAYPDKISLTNLFRFRGLRTRRFFLGSILGISLCAIFIAYQIAFYLLANRFGAWAPADVPYTDLLNTRFPWLFVLLGGFLPAVSEEFMFRMFAIPFLRKLARGTAVAVVLAGFIWGFGHAGYPNQPFYIRGVEVGIGGVALGLIMLRWGILPTLIWHYSVDAMYSALLLVRSGNLYLRFSAVAAAGILVLPALLAFVAYLRKGGFESETGLLNGDEPAPAEEPEEVPLQPATTVAYRPLAIPLRLVALAVFVLGLLSLLIPTHRFGDSPDYRIPPAEAEAAANKFLRNQGTDPSGFRHITYPDVYWGGEDSLAAKYLLERRPLSAVANMFDRNRPLQHWLTRYFKSLDQEEAFVSVHPENGKVLGFQHVIPEDRPGADLDSQLALRIAATFAAAQGWDLSAMELKESSSEKKKARRDHTLIWEAKDGDPRNVDETRYRISITVAGDQVSGGRAYWKVPEGYARLRSRRNALSIAVLLLRIAVPVGVVIWGVILLIQNIRKGFVPWRPSLRVALPVTFIAVSGMLLSARLLLKGYNTAIPLHTFEAMMGVGLLISAVFLFLMLIGAVGFITSFYPDVLHSFTAPNRKLFGVDAAMVTLMAIGLSLALNQLGALLMDRFHGQAIPSVNTPDLIASAFPALAACAGAVRSLVLGSALLALVAVLIEKLRRSWLLVPLVLIASTGLVSTDVRTGGEFALQYGIAVVTFACIAAFCAWFARRNYLAYFLIFILLVLRSPLSELFGTGNRALLVHGLMVLGILLITVVWALLPALRRTPRLERAAA